MRQVRRKTVDSTAKAYLLKAKNEGIQLSWNKYEAMLPQDGFSLLGLTCNECLQGPCRLNPFDREEGETVCGFSKDDLALNYLEREVKKDNGAISLAAGLILEIHRQQKEGKRPEDTQLIHGLWRRYNDLALVSTNEAYDSNVTERVRAIKAAAAQKVALQGFIRELQELLFGARGMAIREVGLGTLRADSVNICLEGASLQQLAVAEELVKELGDLAISKGAAGGINVVLAGDLTSAFNFNTVTNEGSVEMALLTGLVDLYLVGQEGNGRGRNVAAKYHTVSVDLSSAGKDTIKQLFTKAIEAFVVRDKAKVLASNQLEMAETGYALEASAIKEALQKGAIKGVCLLAGGSNIKVTQDKVAEIVNELAAQDILCLTYGNTAASLGKYGCLKSGGGSVAVAAALGFEKGPVAYSIGSNLDAGKALNLAKTLDSDKVVVVFAELAGFRDLQMTFALAGTGATVVTGVRLPIEGSKVVAEEVATSLVYCKPEEIASKVAGLFVGEPAYQLA